MRERIARAQANVATQEVPTDVLAVGHSSMDLRPIRVLYLIGSLGTGGAESQLLELLRRIDRSHYTPFLALFNMRGADRAAGLVKETFSLSIDDGGYSRFKIRGLKAAAALLKLSGIVRRVRPDIFHAMLPAACILGAVASRLVHVPVFVASRRSLVNCYRNNALLSYADSITTRMADRVVGNSEAVVHEIADLDRVPTGKIESILNGVDITRFQPGNRSFRQKMGWAETDVVFGMVANFIPYKRHIDFVQAASMIAESVSFAKFVMVGEDRGELGAVEEKIEQLGLKERFCVIPGMDRLEDLYPSLDVAVTTSETEGLSNVLLEAAACGLPIIATDVGGNREIVHEGVNGYLVKPRTPSEVTSTAICLARDLGLRLRLGASSRRIARQEFSMEKMVATYDRLYRDVMAEKRAPW
jgi:glycosyltransferase involved in cell wall biosynthesis